MSKTAQLSLLNYGSILVSFGANILMFTVGYGLEVKNWTILVASFVLMVILSSATQSLAAHIMFSNSNKDSQS